MPFSKRLAVSLLVPVVGAAVLLSGCGGSNIGSDIGSGLLPGSPAPLLPGTPAAPPPPAGPSVPVATTGRASFTVQWPERTRGVVPAAANSVKITVMQGVVPAGEQILVRPAGDSASESTATFENLLPGEAVVTAAAFPTTDGTGVVQARSTSRTEVVPGKSAPPVALSLDSTITRVEVTPENPLVGRGKSLPLTATARDAENNIVLTAPGTFEWSSDNAGAASVDSNGVLTGVASGRVSVTATEKSGGKQGTVRVSIVELGIPVDILLGGATGINNQGDVIGGYGSGEANLFLWSGTGGALVDVGPVDDHFGRAYNLDDQGRFVGHVASDTLGPPKGYSAIDRAFLWDGVVTYLNPLSGSQDAQALDFTGGSAVNGGAGWIVGSSFTRWDSNTGVRATIWNRISQTADWLPTELPAPAGLDETVATGVSSRQIIGYGYQKGKPGLTRAVLWQVQAPGAGQPGSAPVVEQALDLGLFGADWYSTAVDINENGDILINASSLAVNYIKVPYSDTRSFLWRNGHAEDLGNLPGSLDTVARDINNKGQIVGYAHSGEYTSDGVRIQHAVMWDKNRRLVDLNDLLPADSGWVLESATGINERNQICGAGRLNGERRVFVLTLPD